MAQAAKRITQSTVQWQKLSEKLTSHHASELAKLKGQNSTFSAQYDFVFFDFCLFKGLLHLCFVVQSQSVRERTAQG